MTFAGFSQHRLRLISGLILFSFALTHLLNHAVGLISLDAMEQVRLYRVAITRSVPGSLVLGLALVVHIGLALYKFASRRSLRMTAWEGVQLVFGLAIPYFLFRHMLGTRLPHELFGVETDYSFVLFGVWPKEAWRLLFLVTLVWVHACIGLHFWLRLKPWYERIVWPLFGVAVLIPVLAYAGYTVAGRENEATYEFENPLTTAQVELILKALDWGAWGALAVVGLAAVLRLVWVGRRRLKPQIRVSYAGGEDVVTEQGASLLEISRNHNIPHASVCGGRARCSTCRVRVLEGLESLEVPSDEEQRVLDRVGAAANVRLACQMVPTEDISVATLLPAHRVRTRDATASDRYTWGVEQEVTLMFADLRGFTALSENKYPYDVVFILNQYLGQMSAAIEDSDGYVDKFIGDGIMAIFGMGQDASKGADAALRAAKAMGGVLGALNKSLTHDLPEPLRIGIGMHTGSAILGRVGVAQSNRASQRITALGDTVNAASRLEGSTKQFGAELVVSATTIAAASIPAGTGQTERIQVKGKQKALDVTVYTRAVSVLPE
ncbi:MAG: adenylate/guanylate cyclase domain-containing protein [Pseudomonadota bacterium]